MIFLKNAPILTSLDVQAHHVQPGSVTPASKRRPFVKCRVYFCRHRMKYDPLTLSIRWRNMLFSLFGFKKLLQFGLQREQSRITLYAQGRRLCSLLLDITAPDFHSDACTTGLAIRVCPEALLVHKISFAETTTVTAPAHLALLPILFKIAEIPLVFWSVVWQLSGHFSYRQWTLIESLGPVPWDTVVNRSWGKLVEFAPQD